MAEGLTGRMAEAELVNSVVRALSVVEALNLQPVTSLEALHRATGLPKPTLVRLLETLIAAGYVHKVSRREGYAVTESVLRLAAGVRHRDVLVDVARPLLSAFTREHKWQVSLGTREDDSMLIRATTRNISPFSREQPFLNRRVSILGSVVGRAYFAWCGAAERGVILNLVKATDGPDARAVRTTDLEALVRSIRERGYAPDRAGRPGPHRSIGVPILRQPHSEDVLGAIVMFWYLSVMPERQAAQRFVPVLNDLAGRIALGVAHHLETDPALAAALTDR
jgi:IclR family mhp operon transcriptional activator